MKMRREKLALFINNSLPSPTDPHSFYLDRSPLLSHCMYNKFPCSYLSFKIASCIAVMYILLFSNDYSRDAQISHFNIFQAYFFPLYQLFLLFPIFETYQRCSCVVTFLFTVLYDMTTMSYRSSQRSVLYTNFLIHPLHTQVSPEHEIVLQIVL